MSRPRLTSIVSVALALTLATVEPGVSAQSRSRLVRIAAASDLRFALDELTARLRESQPDLDVRVTYGSSGTFVAQIVNGAPFDLFLSADLDYPRQLAARGLTVEGSEFTYGVGHLVVWVPAASPLDVEKVGMEALADPRVRHVAIANPATAPYGRAAEAAMRGLGIFDRVKDKVVLGENVAQTLQFVQSGSAEAGVVALSLALAPTARSAGRFWVVPLNAYPRMDQGGVILRTAIDIDAARQFRAFLIGGAARTILRQYGFSLAD
ncbi:MAG: molybdate ABC transporter substrate-binding protein [Vicinamibacterales bacterium]